MSRSFVDPRLELAVREALPPEVLAQPLDSLTHLRAVDLGIRRLGGVEQLRELRWLDLTQNPLASVAELEANTKLIRLILKHTTLSTLRGLGGLPDLEDLDLYASRVVDISDIRGLPSLRSLDIGLCIVRDLAPLASLAKLESLTIGNPSLHIPRRTVYSRNDVVSLDLSAITRLSSLRQLRLYGLRLRSANMLEELVGLEELILENCEFQDQLQSMPRLPRLELLSLSDCHVPKLEVLAELPRLRALYLDDAEVGDLRNLLGLESLEMLSLRDASISGETPIKALRRLPRLAQIRLETRVIRRRP